MYVIFRRKGAQCIRFEFNIVLSIISYCIVSEHYLVQRVLHCAMCTQWKSTLEKMQSKRGIIKKMKDKEKRIDFGK